MNWDSGFGLEALALGCVPRAVPVVPVLLVRVAPELNPVTVSTHPVSANVPQSVSVDENQQRQNADKQQSAGEAADSSSVVSEGSSLTQTLPP